MPTLAGEYQMNGIRCSECGLINLATDVTCRRCGRSTDHYKLAPSRTLSPGDEAKKSTWLYTILIVTLIGAGAYYLFTGFEKSYQQIKADEAKATAVPANQKAEPLSSRGESDQKRTVPFKNAIQNSPGLAAANKRTAETQKLMEKAK